eukprot:scaffold633_cov288-Ochromonas_danica.AAC.66
MDALQNFMVYVPLIGSSRSYGVLEIHGLYPDDRSFQPKTLQRSAEQLRAMMASKDYRCVCMILRSSSTLTRLVDYFHLNRFVETARFWKKLPVEIFAGLPQTAPDNALIMSGRIQEVVFTRNGVPFYGGPRYNILWENGQVDVEMGSNEVCSLFQDTPQSLGAYTRLDSELSSQLFYIGVLLGSFLEGRKSELFIQELKGKMAQQRVNVIGMIEMALQSITTVLTGVKEIYLLGFQVESENDLKILLRYSYAKGNRVTEKFLHSAFDVAVEYLELPRAGQKSGTTSPVSKSISTGRSSSKNLHRVEDNYSTDWLIKEVIMPKSFKWGKTTLYDRYVLVVHKSYTALGGQAFSKFDEDIIGGVAEEIQTSITTLWQHDQRRKNLRDFIKIAEGKLLEWRNLEIDEMCFNMLSFIPKDLLQAHLYVGLLQPGGEVLQFIAANLGSEMEGQEMDREEGISFDVVDTGSTIVLLDKDFDKKTLLQVGALVDVYYGRKLYKGTIRKIWGHDKYDVEYKYDRKTEVGVDIDRILPISRAFRAKKFNAKSQLPFVCVALRHGNKVLGVLGCDHISPDCLEDNKNGGVDRDLQIFLEQMGRLMGSAIDVKLKKSALQAMNKVSKNQHAEIRDLVTTISDAIHSCSAMIQGTMITQYITQVMWQDRVQVLKTLLPPKILEQRGALPKPLEKKIMKMDLAKYGSRPIQKQGRDSIFLLTHMKSASSLASGQGLLLMVTISHLNSIPDIDYDFYETFQNSINSVLFAIISQKASAEIRHDMLLTIQNLCNSRSFPSRHVFFPTIAETVCTCYHSTNMYIGVLGAFNKEIHYIMASKQSNMLDKKLLRSDSKGVSFKAIDEDRTLCILANSELADRLKHFGERQQFEYPFIVAPLVCHIDSVVGVLAADNCAGENTMTDSEESLSDVISFFNSISLYLNKAVRYYRLEDAVRDMQYITQISSSYSEGIAKLLKLVMNFLPFATEIHHITFRPTLLNKVEERKEDDMTSLTSLSYQPPKVANKEPTPENLTILLTITLVEFVNNELVSPHLKVFFQGGCLLSQAVRLPVAAMDQQNTEVENASRHDVFHKPVMVKIPKGIPYDEAVLVAKLYGQVLPGNGSSSAAAGAGKGTAGVGVQQLQEKEIAQKALDLRYFYHSPLVPQGHIFLSTELKNAKAAQISFLSKMFPSTQVVGHYLEDLQVKVLGMRGVELMKDDFSSRYNKVSVTFYWTNLSLGRTRYGADSMPFKWDALDLFIPVTKRSAGMDSDGRFSSSALSLMSQSKEELTIELSSIDGKGQQLVLGALKLSQEELESYLAGQPAWLEAHKINTPLLVKPTNPFALSASRSIDADNEGGTGFFLLISGRNIDGENLAHIRNRSDPSVGNTRILCDLLKLPPPPTQEGMKEATLIEMKRLVSFQNRNNGIKCEIGVLALRDLFISKTNGKEGKLNTFVKVFLNNEQIGSTSIVFNSFNPSWKDERFHIVLFPDDDMENNVLQLEIYQFIENKPVDGNSSNNNNNYNHSHAHPIDTDAAGSGVEELIGSVEVKGFSLTTLLMGDEDHAAWFDFEHIRYPPRSAMIISKRMHRNEKAGLSRLLTSQIKVCGRLAGIRNTVADAQSAVAAVNNPPATSSALTNQTQRSQLNQAAKSHDAKELGYLEMNILSVMGLVANILEGNSEFEKRQDVQCLAVASFNDRKILIASSPDLLLPSAHDKVDNQGEMSSQTSLFHNEKVFFRFPCGKTLYQSKLRVEVYLSKENDSPGGDGSGRAQSPSREKFRDVDEDVSLEEWILCAYTVVTGAQLVSLLGQSGAVTKSFPLRKVVTKGRAGNTTPKKRSDKGDKANAISVPLLIELHGGPEDAPEIFQYDDFMLCLDLLAAIELPHRVPAPKKTIHGPTTLMRQSSTVAAAVRKLTNNEDSRPEVFCMVTWNGRMLGRTAICKRSTHVLFFQERLILPVPIFNSTQSRLFQCNLQIDIYDHHIINDKINLTQDRLIGSVFVDGFVIEQLCNQEGHPRMQWLDIVKTSKPSHPPLLSNQVHFENSFKSYMSSEIDSNDQMSVANESVHYTNSNTGGFANASICGSFKLQLQIAHNTSSTKELSLNDGVSSISEGPEEERFDFLLRLLEAKDLSNTDSYGGANAIADIYWNRKRIGSTQVYRSSTHPIFDNETFILRSDLIGQFPPTEQGMHSMLENDLCELEVQVWSLALNKPRDFLGRVLLKNNAFLEAANRPISQNQTSFMVSTKREMLLRPSDEFTNEENALVKGSLVFELGKLDYQHYIHSEKMTEESVIWIDGAKHIPEVGVWNCEPLYYCRILRSYEREGGEKVEIYRTNAIRSFHPRYERAFCCLTVPADNDWTGFVLTFEICYQEVMIASLTLTGEALRSFLMRAGDQCVEIQTFAMSSNAEIATAKAHGQLPQLLLGGGLKASFDAQTAAIDAYYEKLLALETMEKASTVDSEAFGDTNQDTAEQRIDEDDWPSYFSNIAQPFILDLGLTGIDANNTTNVQLDVYWNNTKCASRTLQDIQTSSSSTRFELEKTADQSLSSCELKFIATIDHGSQMATLTLAKKRLLELLEARLSGSTMTLVANDIEHNIFLHIWLRIRPRGQSSTLIDPSSTLPKYATERLLTVLAACDLSKPTVLGNGADVFAMVTYCGVKVFESSLVKNSLDPIWTDAVGVSLRFPKELDKYLMAVKGDEDDGNSSVGSRVGRAHSIDSIASSVRLEDVTDTDQPVDDLWMVEDFELIIELFHAGKTNKQNVYLGCVEMRGSSFFEFILSQELHQYHWLALTTSTRKTPIEQKFVNRRSRISLLTSRIASPSSQLSQQMEGYSLDKKSVDIFVLSTRGLLVGKNTDIYAVLRLFGGVRGKTNVDRHCGSAAQWENEKFTSHLPFSMMEHFCSGRSIVIEVEVWQYLPKKVDLLVGVGQLTYNQLLDCLDHDGAKSIWLPLRLCDYFPEKYLAVKEMTGAGGVGEVELRCQYSNPLIAMQSAAADIAAYKICIRRIANLPQGYSLSNTGYSVIVKWNDREIGRTKEANVKSGQPQWKDADGNEILLPIERKRVGNISDSILSLEVWNQQKGLFGTMECVGNIILTGDELLSTLQLVNGVDQTTGQPESDDQRAKATEEGAMPVVGETIYHHKLTETIPGNSSLRSIKKFLPGELEFSIELIDKTNEQYATHKGATLGSKGLKDIAIHWQDVADVQAGSSFIEIKLISSTLTFIASSLINGMSAPLKHNLFGMKRGQPATSCQVICRVIWCGQVVMHSAPVSIDENEGNGTQVSWSRNSRGEEVEHTCYLSNHYTLPVKANDRSLKFELCIATAAATTTTAQTTSQSPPIAAVDANEEPLASLELPFQILLRLYCGQFIFALYPQLTTGQINNLANPVVFTPGQHNANSILNKWQNKLWSASLTFQIKFLFTYWDSLLYSSSAVYKRKIVILGAMMLPPVNNEFPNSRCTVSIDDVVVGKSPVILSSCNPVYSRLSIDLMVDLIKPVEIKVQVIHVHAKTRREVVLGEEIIPFEYLLKPPKDAFDLYLGPSQDRKNQPSVVARRGKDARDEMDDEFRFSLSGYLRMQIVGNNDLEKDKLSLSTLHDRDPTYVLDGLEYSILSIHDGHVLPDGGSLQMPASVAPTVGSSSIDGAGEAAANAVRNSKGRANSMIAATTAFLTDRERAWLGSSFTGLSQCQPASNLPAFLLLPLHDIGIVVGRKRSRLIGVQPGHRSVLAIKRQEDHLSMSDATLLEDLSTYLSSSIVKLRWKDINRNLRSMSLHYLDFALKKFAYDQLEIEDVEDLDHVQAAILDVIIRLILHCIPGCTVRKVSRSSDQQLLHYDSYTDSGSRSRGNSNHKEESHAPQPLHSNRVILSADIGQDGEFFRRCYNHSYLINHVSDVEKKCVTLFQTLPLQRFPRFNLILFAEDAPMGLIQIENMDSLNGGLLVSRQQQKRVEEGKALMSTAAPTSPSPTSAPPIATSSYDSLLTAAVYQSHSLSNASEMRKWLEDIGQRVGALLYDNTQSLILDKLHDFFHMWNYSLDALMVHLLHYLPFALKNCQLMEIMEIEASDYKIKSLLEVRPKVSTVFGRRVQLSNVRLVRKANNAAGGGGGGGDDQSQRSGSTSYRTTDNNSTASSANGWQGLKGLFKKNAPAKATTDESPSTPPSPVAGALNRAEEEEEEEEEEESVFDHGDGSEQPDDNQSWHARGSRGGGDGDDDGDGNLSTNLSKGYFLLAIRYDGIEQLLTLSYDPSTRSFSSDRDIILYIKTNRQVVLACYEIDDYWNVLQELRGVVNVALNENGQMKAVLEPLVGGGSSSFSLDVVLQVQWSSPGSGEESGYSLEKQLANLSIKNFHIQVVGCRGLKKMKGSTSPTAFCEVYQDGRLIASTSTVKEDTNPVWNHALTIPYRSTGNSGGNTALTLDVYDMTFLRRGNFLGRVELPFEALIDPLTQEEQELTLQPRLDFQNMKKNAFVGGVLVVKLSVEKEDEIASPTAGTAATTKGKSKAPSRASLQGVRAVKKLLNAVEADATKQMIADAVADVNQVKNPVLLLTVESGQDLLAVNRFSGSSDPFVVVALKSEGGEGEEEEAGAPREGEDNVNVLRGEVLAKTKVILNNVLNPTWQETLTIPLYPFLDRKKKKKKGVRSIEDYPDVLLFAYHQNKLTQPVLLGETELSAALYVLESKASLPLALRKKGKDNAAGGPQPQPQQQQGALHVHWTIVDESGLSLQEQQEDGQEEGGEGRKNGFHFGLQRHLHPVLSLELKLIKATNLAKIKKLWGGQNCYLVVYYQGKVVGKTTIKPYAPSIAFNHRISIPLATCGDEHFDELVIKVLTSEPLQGQDLFLGQCSFTYAQVVHKLAVSQSEHEKESEEGEEKLFRLSGRIGTPESPPAEGSLVLQAHVTYATQSLHHINLLTSHQAFQFLPELPNGSHEIMPLLLIYDPDLEASRLKKDQLSLPDLLNRVGLQAQRYASQPFTRTGLISEAHYGQLCAAFRRGERTILKSDVVEQLCLPLFRKKDERMKDIFPRYLVARYHAKDLPRRDLQFLDLIHKAVTDGLEGYLGRQERMNRVKGLVDSVQKLVEESSSSPHEVIMQFLLELDAALAPCSVKLYLLSDHGQDYLPVSIETGKIDPSTSSSPNPLIASLAKLVRYDVIIQYYRGSVRLLRMAWKDKMWTQYQLPDLSEGIEEEIDHLEGPGFTAATIDQMKRFLHNGGFVLPLLPNAEYLMGVLILKDINSLPSALYEYVDKGKTVDQEEGEVEPDHKDGGGGGGGDISLWMVDLTAPKKAIQFFEMATFRSHTTPWDHSSSSSSARSNLSHHSGQSHHHHPPAPAPAPPHQRDASSSSVTASSSTHRPNRPPPPAAARSQSLLSRWFGFGGKKATPLQPIDENREVSSSATAIAWKTSSAQRIKLGVFGSTSPRLLLDAPHERHLQYPLGSHAKRGKEVKSELEASKLAEFKVVPLANLLNNTPPPPAPPAPASAPAATAAATETNATSTESGTKEKNLKETIIEEIRLCSQELKQKAFRVASGHALCSLGDDNNVHQLLMDMFNFSSPPGEVTRVPSNQWRPSDAGSESSYSSHQRSSRRVPAAAAAPAPPPPPLSKSPSKVTRTSKKNLNEQGNLTSQGSQGKLQSQSSAVLSKKEGSFSSTPAPPPPPADMFTFFIAINTHGLGGQSGWGVLGEKHLSLLRAVSAALEERLLKLYGMLEGAADESMNTSTLSKRVANVAVSGRSDYSEPSAGLSSKNDSEAF